MTRSTLSSALLLALAVMTWSPRPGLAQPIEGTWRYAGGPAEASARSRAVESAAQQVPALFRSTARARLTEMTTPPPQLSIQIEDRRVTLTGRGRSIELSIGGSAVRVEEGGHRAEVQAMRRGGNLVVAMRGNNGVRTTTYRVSADGQHLVLVVRMTGGRLDQPLEYRATYRRS